jgi:hypothetical protein
MHLEWRRPGEACRDDYCSKAGFSLMSASTGSWDALAPVVSKRILRAGFSDR